jgi:digeranylgeranylglycerophospholipid reductase
VAVHVDGGEAMARRMNDTGVILHRDRFEHALCVRAEAAGAQVRLNTTVTGLAGAAQAWTGVLCDGEHLAARMVIGADGAESYTGRWAGICSALAVSEAYTAAQYRVQTDFCNDGMMHFFAGSHTIDQGYAWVFPKGDGEVSMGAGLYGERADSRRALALLDAFVERAAPDAPRRMLISGCAPVTVCPSRLSRGNVAVVGDAARQVNPLTAGGIMNALEAADLLARCVTRTPDRPAAALRAYSAAWRRRMRMEQKVFLVLQRVFLGLGDAQLRNMLTRAEAAFEHMADRSQTFRWPVVDLCRLFLMLARKAPRHLPLLLR